MRGFTDIVIRTLEKGIPPKEVNDKTVCRIKYVLAFCYHRIGMPESASKHIKDIKDIKDIITSRTKDNYIISDLATTKLDELSKLISKEAESSEPTAVSKDHKNNPFAYHDVFSKFNRDSVLKYIYHDWTMDGSKITGYNKSRQEFFEEVVNKAENLKNNTLFRGSFVNMLTDYIDGSEGWIDWRGVRHNRTLRYFREKEKESFVLRQNANNGLSPESLRDSVRVTSADNLRELFEYAREQAVKEYFTNGDHQAAQCIIFDYNIGNAVDFYCDKRTLSDALTRIFKDMLQLYMQLYKGKELTIEIEHRKEKSPDGGSSYVVTLTQRNATTSRTCKEFCDKLSNGGGNFSDVRNILRNVCDWSVETIWTDGPRRVNCLSAYEDLTVDASEDLASLTNDQNKFRHIFRIYNT